MPGPQNFCRRRVIHRWLRGASTRSPRQRRNNSGNRMRTVRESFPSYGSSPHKAQPVKADPHVGIPKCLAIIECSRNVRVSVGAPALRRINRRASVVICFLSQYRFYMLSCHFRPDRRGPIQRIAAGLRFFGHPNAAPPDPPYGKVCRLRPRARLAAFPRSVTSTGWFRSALYTGSSEFASACVTDSEPDC